MRLLKASGALLCYSEGQSEGPALQRAVAAVAEVACSQSPPVWSIAVAAVESLRAAEAGAAREKAAVGYAFVAFDEALQLCCSLVAQRLPSNGAQQAAVDTGRWQLMSTAADCLADTFSRAQLCITSKVRGPALRQAEVVLRTAVSTALAAQLCCCLAEASAAAAAGSRNSASAAVAAAAGVADAAAGAVLNASLALVHIPAVKANGSCVADHFPLAQLLSAKITDVPDQGLDSDANLLDVSACCLAAF